MFLRKVGKIILVTTVLLWVLLNLPVQGAVAPQKAGVDPRDEVTVSSHVIRTALRSLTVEEGPRSGELLFTAPVVAALLAFFLFALQCMSTIGALWRESGSWRWPAIAFGYMFTLAWIMALAARLVVGVMT